MTDLQKSIYANMKSIDRVLAWLIKAEELNELSALMTKDDFLMLRNMLEVNDQ